MGADIWKKSPEMIILKVLFEYFSYCDPNLSHIFFSNSDSNVVWPLILFRLEFCFFHSF